MRFLTGISILIKQHLRGMERDKFTLLHKIRRYSGSSPSVDFHVVIKMISPGETLPT